MKPVDWTRFRKRIHIHCPAETVYRAWAVPGQIEQWFLERADYQGPDGRPRPKDQPVQTGDTFAWKWHNWDFREQGRILTADGRSRLAFTFGKGGNVHVELQETAGTTEVTLTQDEIPTDEQSKQEIYTGCATGWTFWLANLKAWLEHGITLHATGLKQGETADLVNS